MVLDAGHRYVFHGSAFSVILKQSRFVFVRRTCLASVGLEDTTSEGRTCFQFTVYVLDSVDVRLCDNDNVEGADAS